MLHHHRMHVENELAEIVTTDDHEFEEIIKEYEEEILVQEKVLEPPLTYSANTAPAQGKPRCITPYFWIITVYICYVHLCYRNFMKKHMHKYICPKSLTSIGSSSCYA